MAQKPQIGRLNPGPSFLSYKRFMVVLPVVRRLQRTLEGEGCSAQYTTVISQLRKHNSKLPMLPRADQLGEFVVENRNQEWIARSQAATQNYSLRVKKCHESGTAP